WIGGKAAQAIVEEELAFRDEHGRPEVVEDAHEQRDDTAARIRSRDGSRVASRSRGTGEALRRFEVELEQPFACTPKRELVAMPEGETRQPDASRGPLRRWRSGKRLEPTQNEQGEQRLRDGRLDPDGRTVSCNAKGLADGCRMGGEVRLLERAAVACC